MFDFEHLLSCIGDSSQQSSPLFEQVNKRDSFSMGNRYFETVDERMFYKCSVSQYLHRRKEAEDYAKYKNIEKLFEERLKRGEMLQQEEQQQQVAQGQRQFFSGMTGMFRTSNNS